MNHLLAGFGRCDITPMTGIALSGYFKPRYATGVLDPLEATAFALRAGGATLAIVSVDACFIEQEDAAAAVRHIAAANGLPEGCVFLACTHTHTSPYLGSQHGDAAVRAFYPVFLAKAADAARFALADLRPARLGWGVGEAKDVAFVRRFRMKDGSCRTNPGIGNPDILRPIGEADGRVGVVRIDREGAGTLVLAHFANHPDVVGGSQISADWPGFARRTVERALPGSRCLLLNGAQGDVNHVDVRAAGAALNGLSPDFDDVHRGAAHARHIANVVAGAVLQVYEKVKYTDVDSVRCLRRDVRVASNMPAPEELEAARHYNALHLAGRDADIPFEGMELTTVVAEAMRMVALEHGPEYFTLPLTGAAFGEVALVGIPGEPFTGIGRGLRAHTKYPLVLPCCLVNGNEGYFPMRDAYDEGGYEARSSRYRAGVAEELIAQGRALLDAL